jgi:uncharacterized protein YdeI (YjbR/CyaY-like superfamily)
MGVGALADDVAKRCGGPLTVDFCAGGPPNKDTMHPWSSLGLCHLTSGMASTLPRRPAIRLNFGIASAVTVVGFRFRYNGSGMREPATIKTFRTDAAFEKWLRTHHNRAPEIWIRIYKKSSGIPTVTPAEALDVALCWGWIDGIRKGSDETSFLQRYCPRRPRSVWSQINRDNVARLIGAGRMTPQGQRQIDAAKADGRWDAAYAPMAKTTAATVPEDLRAAIEASPRARATFRTLGRQNLFALAFRTNNMRTPAGRARKIAVLVAMLERGETIIPERPRQRGA